MKKLILLSAIVAIALMVGCSKEDLTEQQTVNENSTNLGEIKLVELSDGKGAITLLEFIDIDHYENTISDLERQMEEHDDAFIDMWGYLDGDLLEAKEEEVGFVDHQPLIDFEDYYNIPSTMRQYYVAAETIWLDNDELDLTTDPALRYCFSMAEMTLLNPLGEVKIGSTLYKFTEKGYVQIANTDVATLIRIDDGDITAYDEPTVTTNIEFNGGGKGSCTGWKGYNSEHPYANKRKVKRHVHFHAYPWKAVSKAELTSYKKKNNGNWKKYRISMGVANQTYFRTYYCNPATSMWASYKYKTRKSYSRGNTNWGTAIRRAENGQSVIGYFKYAGNTTSLVLSW